MYPKEYSVIIPLSKKKVKIYVIVDSISNLKEKCSGFATRLE